MREYRNRICSAVLAAVCVIGTALIPSRAVHAEDVVDPIAVQKQAAYDAVPETNGLENWPQGPHVYANSAIVMEMNSGAILYGKKINDKHYPASITKLLTALVALENADPDDEVYFSEDSVSFLEYGDASIGMRPGEILSMNDALYGMLLASANEVSYAIAESVGKKMGGGFETFIQKMNERCEELGCTGSHWTNANGLHDENHYTTAHDMALIGSAVYQFDKFREVTQTLNYTIPPTNLVNESRTFQQNHKMLWVGAHYSYDYCTGGKTGYTDQAKTTLVTMADNADMQLVAVVLEDQGDAYVVLPKGIDVSSLEHEITITDRQNAAGKLTYLYKGQNVGTVEVKLTADYIKEETGYNIEPEMKSVGKKSTDKEEKTEMPIYVKLLIAVVLLVIILLAVLFSLLKYRQVKRRRARQLARKRKKALERRRSNTEQTGENAFRRQSSAGRRKNTQIRNRQVDDRRSGSYRRRDREGRYR